MKRSFALALCIFIFLTASLNTTKAQYVPLKICFNDDAGDTYEFTNIVLTGFDRYYAEGTANIFAPVLWDAKMWLDFSAGYKNGVVTIHLINPQANHCDGAWVDSVIMNGKAEITKTESLTTYSGSLDFNNYCFGQIIVKGDATAAGPCSNGALKRNPNSLIGRSTGVRKNEQFSFSATPNPVKNYTRINYKLNNTSKINFTIYDYMGKPVKVLLNETKTAGNYSVEWNALNANGTPVPNGLYKVTATVGSKVYSTTLQVER